MLSAVPMLSFGSLSAMIDVEPTSPSKCLGRTAVRTEKLQARYYCTLNVHCRDDFSNRNRRGLGKDTQTDRASERQRCRLHCHCLTFHVWACIVCPPPMPSRAVGSERGASHQSHDPAEVSLRIVLRRLLLSLAG